MLWLNCASEWLRTYSSTCSQNPLSSLIFLHCEHIGTNPRSVFTCSTPATQKPHGTEVLERYPQVVAITLFFWRLNDPEVMDGVQSGNLLYLLLVLALVPMVSSVGWFGATMTFPIEKK